MGFLGDFDLRHLPPSEPVGVASLPHESEHPCSPLPHPATPRPCPSSGVLVSAESSVPGHVSPLFPTLPSMPLLGHRSVIRAKEQHNLTGDVLGLKSDGRDWLYLQRQFKTQQIFTGYQQDPEGTCGT